jgi:hypothetical protein
MEQGVGVSNCCVVEQSLHVSVWGRRREKVDQRRGEEVDGCGGWGSRGGCGGWVDAVHLRGVWCDGMRVVGPGGGRLYFG